MGIYSDILEDNLERTGRYLDVLVIQTQPPAGGDTTHPAPPLIHCPLCGEIIIRDIDLTRHYLDKHSNRYAYLLLDGNVVRNIIYTDSKISSISAHLINIPRARIYIAAEGLKPVECDFTEKISILEYLRHFRAGEISITIHIPGGFKQQYSIYCQKLPDIRIEEIDRASSELLFYALNENREPEWNAFQRLCLSPERHPLEREYSEGLYEYAVGIHTIRNGHDGKDRLESALGKLSAFRTTHAVTIRRILALRMNLFGLLRACTPPSRFAAVNDFFNNRAVGLSRKRKKVNDVSDKGSREYGYAVYIDPFTEMFLDAVQAYYDENNDLLDNLCTKLDSLRNEMDRNNRDKLFLLRARAYMKRKDESAAKSYYQMLTDNPDFRQEAREVLDGAPSNKTV